MHYFTDVLKKYFVFTGRASRKEFWMFQLLLMIIMTIVIMAIAVFVAFMVKDQSDLMAALLIFMSIYVVLSLLITPPSLAVLVRRLHDVSKSGWWYFMSFIPIIGGIWLLVLLVTEGTHGPNEYGPDPYATTTPAPEVPTQETPNPTVETSIGTPLQASSVEPMTQADIDAVVIKPELPASEF